MIRNAFRFLSLEVRGLHAAVFVLAFSALLSSLLALGRDRLLAHVFGAGMTLDVYYAAFRIPDLIFVGTGALVSVYILIPEIARRSKAEQKKYLDSILVGFSVFAVCISLIAGIFAPYFLSILFPQMVQSGSLPALTLLTRVMLMQPIFLGISNIFAAVTQYRNRYALYSISPLLYNLGIILGVVLLYPMWGIVGLAWGVVIGAALHAIIQVPSLIQDGFLIHMPMRLSFRTLFTTALISLPRALALSMSEIAELGLIALAGLLTSGSIAIFVFAFNLQAVPLAIIGSSYSVAAFPTLAAALSRGDKEVFLNHVATAMRYVFFWSMPATALIVVLRAHIVRVVLGSGHFDWTDTRLTAAVFALFALSLAAQGITLLLLRAYYAAGRTFVPFLVSCATGVITIVLATLFVGSLHDFTVLVFAQNIMRVQDLPGTEVLALGLAYALASIFGACVLLIHFEHRFGDFLRRVSRAWWESFFVSLVVLFTTYYALVIAGPLDVGSTSLSVFLKGLAGGLVGLLSAGLTYWVLGSIELHETVLSIYGRFVKGSIAPATGAAIATAAEDQPGQS
jgi:putative peptidoglycan lipid II flippase